jgi:predicted transcriptional regulator|nr:MAG TPA: Cro/C1-type HTH DNA-binding domain protein [Bacteriophage sp.]
MKKFVVRMFGDAISERMKELEMTKTALIKQAEISMDTLNRAIKGKSVQMSTVVGICYALCVDDNESHDFWETDYYNPKLDRR